MNKLSPLMYPFRLRLLPLILLTFISITLCSITPVIARPLLAQPPNALLSRSTTDVIIESTPRGAIVINPDTGVGVYQAPATDGGGLIDGNKFSAPPLIWIGFSTVVGLPLSLAGVRGYRLTTGVGLGVTAVLPVWAGLINTLGVAQIGSSQQVGDIVITLVCFGAFVIGFSIGFIRIGLQAGVIALGAAAGLSLGFRLAIIKANLLIPIYGVNWIPIALFVAIGMFYVVYHQRMGIIVASSCVGSFFIILAIDLFTNGQSGMSKGLRYLLDRNLVHAIDMLAYDPPLTTQIYLASSLGIIPFLAYLQHKVFPKPFEKEKGSLADFGRRTTRDSSFLP